MDAVQDRSYAAMEARKSESIGNLVAALVAARAAMRTVGKGGSNERFRYTYAQLSDYDKAIGDGLHANGLHVIDHLARVDYTGAGKETIARVLLETTVVHTSGEWMSVISAGEGRDVYDKAVYKAITGARKYAIAMLLRLVTTDDPEHDSEPEPERPRSNGRGGNTPAATPPAAATKKPAAPPRGQDTPGPSKPSGSDFIIGSAAVLKETEKWTLYGIISDTGDQFRTFSRSFWELAMEHSESGEPVTIHYTAGKHGNQITDIKPATGARPPGAKVTTGAVERCEHRPMENAAGEVQDVWFLHYDGAEYGTRDARLAERIEELAGTGQEVSFIWQQVDNDKRRLIAIED